MNTCHGGDNSPNGQHTNLAPPNALSSSEGSKRRRDSHGSGEPYDGSRDGGEKRPSKVPRSSPGKEEKNLRLKFACPFFKRDADSNRTWRACAGPGWDTVHRVK